MEEDSDEGQRSDQPTLLKLSTVRLPQQPEATPHITHNARRSESGPKQYDCIHRFTNTDTWPANGVETNLFTLWLVS